MIIEKYTSRLNMNHADAHLDHNDESELEMMLLEDEEESKCKTDRHTA